MAKAQKTFNSHEVENYDKAVSQFLNEIGDRLLNITYSSAGMLVPVQHKITIHSDRTKQALAPTIINSCYIIYEAVEEEKSESEKQPTLTKA